MARFLDLYGRFNDALAAALMLAAAGIGFGIFVIFVVGAATRYITGIGYDWSLDLPPMLVPWTVFLAIGPLLRQNRHITMDMLPAFTVGRTRLAVDAAGLIISLTVAIVFSINGAEVTQIFRDFGQRAEMEIYWPLWWTYISLPIGFALFANFALEGLLKNLAVTAGLRSAQVAAPHAYVDD